jgi:YHS domain-containing protein
MPPYDLRGESRMNKPTRVHLAVSLPVVLLALSLLRPEAAMSEPNRPCCSVGMAQPEEADIPRTQDRKEIGDAFTCPVDGMTGRVSADTPATEFRGVTYYFCNEDEKRLFLENPDRYVDRP